MDFAKRLKQLREARKLTQEELGIQVGKTIESGTIARTTISGYELGSRSPDLETLDAFADFFNVDVDYLLGRKDTTTVIDFSAPNILAAHATEDLTEEEMEEVRNYIAFLKSKRK